MTPPFKFQFIGLELRIEKPCHCEAATGRLAMTRLWVRILHDKFQFAEEKGRAQGRTLRPNHILYQMPACFSSSGTLASQPKAMMCRPWQ